MALSQDEQRNLWRVVDAQRKGGVPDAPVHVEVVSGLAEAIARPAVARDVAALQQVEPAPAREHRKTHVATVGMGRDRERSRVRRETLEAGRIVHKDDARRIRGDSGKCCLPVVRSAQLESIPTM